MKGRGIFAVWCAVYFLFFNQLAWAEIQPVDLAEEDCLKCHMDIVNTVQEKGGGHQDVACMECHAEHPPKGQDVIPACDMCHAQGDSSHYAVSGCNDCHNPHSPGDIDLSVIDPAKPACLSCHPDQGSEMQTAPSEHAALDCKECHTEHGQSMGCLECHETHADPMTDADCLGCHKPHSPTEVAYGNEIPSGFCVCCHEKVGTDLSASPKAHNSMQCIECHESRHTAASSCDACHDEDIHGTYMHGKFPECLTCHKDPHALAE